MMTLSTYSRVVSLVGLYALLASLPVQASAFQSQPTDKPLLLADDERLTQHLNIEAPFASIGDVLTELSRVTKVRLRALDPVDQENVTIIVKDKPVGEVLDVIATTFGYHWMPSNEKRDAYVLSMDQKTWAREKSLRDQYLRSALSSLDDDVQFIRQHHRLSVIEASDRINELLKAGEKPGVTPAQRENGRHEAELLSAVIGDSPDAPLLNLFTGLSAEQISKLSRGEVLRFSLNRIHGMPALSRDTANGILKTGDDDTVKWYQDHPPSDVRAELRVQKSLLEVVLQARSQRVGQAPPEFSPAANTVFRIPAKVKAKVDDDSLDGPEAPPDERLRKSINYLYRQKTPAVNNPATYVKGFVVSDVLGMIADQEKSLCFIADAYLNPVKFGDIPRKELWGMLKQITMASKSTLSFDSRGYVQIRSREVFRRRPQSIPAPLLRAIAERAVKSNGLSLGDYSWIARTLTDDQIEGLRDNDGREVYLQWPPLDMPAINRAKHYLRFLATLRPEQFTNSQTGNPQPFAKLSPEQKAAYQLALAGFDQIEQPDIDVVFVPLEILIRSAFYIDNKEKEGASNGRQAVIHFTVPMDGLQNITAALPTSSNHNDYVPKSFEDSVPIVVVRQPTAP